MQAEILEKNPTANIEVYAAWFAMLPGDRRAAWDPALMSDPRVTHYWDDERVLGRWFADNVGFSGGSVAWDVYYLYGPDTTWDQMPRPLISSGYTLFGERSRLTSDLEFLFAE